MRPLFNHFEGCSGVKQVRRTDDGQVNGRMGHQLPRSGITHGIELLREVIGTGARPAPHTRQPGIGKFPDGRGMQTGYLSAAQQPNIPGLTHGLRFSSSHKVKILAGHCNSFPESKSSPKFAENLKKL
jgi:hypothetical protein